LARRTGPRFVEQTVKPLIQKTLTPFATVWCVIPSLPATSMLGRPAAHSSTMRECWASACAVDRFDLWIAARFT
jgi:hypothetical protein